MSLNLNAPADVTLSLDKTDETKETKVDIAYIEDLVVEVLHRFKKALRWNFRQQELIMVAMEMFRME